MFILIQDRNRISSYELNKDIEYDGIHIYFKNDKYYIELKKGLYFVDSTKCKELKVGKYTIKLDKAFYTISIYVYENSTGYYDYKLYKNTNFLIANDSKANIISKDIYLSNYYLALQNGKLSSNYDILVNHNQYNDFTLKQGDIIEYLGTKIIYFEEFLYINSFNLDIHIDEYKPIYTSIKYIDTKLLDHYYIPEDIYELEVPSILEYEKIKKPNNFDFIKSLIPNFIMCLTMGLMASINYLNTIKNTDANILSFILMPISMLISSIIVPIIFMVISSNKCSKDINKSKQDYINYLIDYENKLISNIDKYIDSLNSRFFNLLDSKKKMFYASIKSDEYMKISIGHISIPKDIDINMTNDIDIDEHLNSIKKRLNNIDNFPLYLDIKKNKKISVISKNIDKQYYFNSYLLEIAYKHHYDDINIGIYSKDTNIFNNVYNLPHLFIGKRRITLNKQEQLQALDQCKLNKPLILFMYDKSNYEFTNDNIYQIYFSTDLKDILKNTDAIVEYQNNKGYLYENNKTCFAYIKTDVDFNSYFSYLGRFKKLNTDSNNYSFLDIFKDDINSYYNNNNHTLRASFAYENNEILSLDLHESKQGPHGLIGGSTGSGKSELIVSLLLSLCIRYSPTYLNVVLIDYKGDGLKESLTSNGTYLPHIVASVSNLENNSLKRLIIVLHNECIYRQNLFKSLSKLSNTSIMNLDDYIDCNDFNLPDIAHLLIVVDEFAELKKESPEEIKELISLSRIGRSLGLHLILATQKPAGVIDDEIWSNSRFKIALKVFDEKDSQDLIKTKDAAYIRNPGSFLMHVDGAISKATCIYSKTDINRNDPYKISILDSELNIIKTHKKTKDKLVSNASYYVGKIIEASKNYKIRQINYLPPHPIDRTNIKNKPYLIFGQVDDYINSKTGLLSYDLKESILIYSSRKGEINSVLNTLNEYSRRTIVISNKVYNGSYISDSLLYDSKEDIEYLLQTLLSNKNNDLTLVIEDISCLLSYDEGYLDKFIKLVKRKDNINISLIFISSSTQLNFKLINSFKYKIMIGILDKSDLSAFYGCRSIYSGNSFFYLDMPICFVPIKIEKYIESKPIFPNIVKRIPEYIEKDISNGNYLLGYDEQTKLPVYYSSDICVISLDQELLNSYAVSYDGIKAYLYNYKLNIPENSPILWLGKGIFNQRLFITGLKEDIDSNHGILFTQNKTILLRRINNV